MLLHGTPIKLILFFLTMIMSYIFLLIFIVMSLFNESSVKIHVIVSSSILLLQHIVIIFVIWRDMRNITFENNNSKELKTMLFGVIYIIASMSLIIILAHENCLKIKSVAIISTVMVIFNAISSSRNYQ